MPSKAQDDDLVMSLVDLALNHPVHQREAYLRSACGDDTQLFEETWTYVRWEERMQGFLLDPLYPALSNEHPFESGQLLDGRFRIVREWCLEMPDVINISVNTPYPGTESWVTDGRRLETRDYRLFDIQHAVLPTRLPLAEFYRELVTTQRAILRKHLDWHQLWDAGNIVARLLLRGQTNFVRSLFQLNKVYRPELLLADHAAPVSYQIPLPPPRGPERAPASASLYIHAPRGRRGRATDAATEQFVEETRMGGTP